MATRQLDLLIDWEPPPATVKFAEEQVRAASLSASISKAIAAALGEAQTPREEIAARMSAFLGARISLNMLNNYASAAKEEQAIPLARFVALLHATRDRRLLEFIAEQCGWAVVERRHLPLIQLAQVEEHIEEMRRHSEALKRQAKLGGSC